MVVAWNPDPSRSNSGCYVSLFFMRINYMIITFLYRFTGSTVRYYGKYIGRISDDYEEGLDRVLAEILFPVFQSTYHVSSVEEVHIGIIDSQRNPVDYASEHEKEVFDLLFCQWSNQPHELWIHGTPQKIGGGRE